MSLLHVCKRNNNSNINTVIVFIILLLISIFIANCKSQIIFTWNVTVITWYSLIRPHNTYKESKKIKNVWFPLSPGAARVRHHWYRDSQSVKSWGHISLKVRCHCVAGSGFKFKTYRLCETPETFWFRWNFWMQVLILFFVCQFISQRHKPVRGSALKLLLDYLRTFPCKVHLIQYQYFDHFCMTLKCYLLIGYFVNLRLKCKTERKASWHRDSYSHTVDNIFIVITETWMTLRSMHEDHMKLHSRCCDEFIVSLNIVERTRVAEAAAWSVSQN